MSEHAPATHHAALFEDGNIGSIAIPNRIVMGPLTRSRASQPGDVPNPDTFYGGGAEGYTDYPTLEDRKAKSEAA
ncbi:MAG: hypothetical protein AAGJ70_00280 [Pseudomonadota bacterium]